VEPYTSGEHAGPRKVIPVTCSVHRNTPGFTNLVVSKANNMIKLDCHATGACVIWFDEDGAIALRDLFTEWLG